MEKNNWLKKPIVLSLLFLPIVICISLAIDIPFELLKINYGIIVIPVSFTITAFIFGLIYTKTSKEMLSKEQKMKIFIYSTVFALFIDLFLSAIFLDLAHKAPAFLIANIIIMLSAFIFIFLSTGCIYPALGLGCKIANSGKANNTEKTKLQDCLLIIFFIVLTMFYNKIYNKLIDVLTTPVMEHMGYVRVKHSKVEQKRIERNKEIKAPST